MLSIKHFYLLGHFIRLNLVSFSFFPIIIFILFTSSPSLCSKCMGSCASSCLFVCVCVSVCVCTLEEHTHEVRSQKSEDTIAEWDFSLSTMAFLGFHAWYQAFLPVRSFYQTQLGKFFFLFFLIIIFILFPSPPSCVSDCMGVCACRHPCLCVCVCVCVCVSCVFVCVCVHKKGKYMKSDVRRHHCGMGFFPFDKVSSWVSCFVSCTFTC